MHITLGTLNFQRLCWQERWSLWNTIFSRYNQLWGQQCTTCVTSCKTIELLMAYFRTDKALWPRHDWDDEHCIKILSALAPTVIKNPNSRVLICDSVMNTTYGLNNITSAPSPLLHNYGHASRFVHLRDMNMLTLFNGRERTAMELSDLARHAGLKVERIWPCRGVVWITELRALSTWSNIFISLLQVYEIVLPILFSLFCNRSEVLIVQVMK